MFTVALAGDVMLGRGVDQALRAARSPEEPWGDVLPLLLEADARVANLECALTTTRRPWMRSRKLFHFRADPGRAVAVLKAARLDACSLANNHVLDFEEAGLLDTLRHLDAAGIAHAGAGRNLGEASAPAVLPGPVPVALVSLTDNEPSFRAGETTPGTFFLPISLEREPLRALEAALGRAREVARVVVLSAHWGPNLVEQPSALHQAFAKAAIDRGADVFFGHSAHLFQGVELYRGKPILYDCGDFLDDHAVDGELRNDWSFLFRVSFEGRAFARLEMVPVALGHAHVNLAQGAARSAIVARMRGLSRDLGAEPRVNEGRLVLEPPSRFGHTLHT
ncbi:MAG TPA: CapA family protein [Longimicrobium sp.]|nr:CapA family protein [Longimicrobium sp.]